MLKNHHATSASLVLSCIMLCIVTPISFGSAQSSYSVVSTRIDLTLSPPSIEFGDSINISATLLDENGDPIADQPIVFSAPYVQFSNIGPLTSYTTIGLAYTDSLGNVTMAYTLDDLQIAFGLSDRASNKPIKASYSGNENYSSCEAQKPLVINPLNSSIVFDAPPTIVLGEAVTLKASLKGENGNSFPCNLNSDTAQFYLHDCNRVLFLIYEGGNWQGIGSGVFGSDGVASINYTPSERGILQLSAFFLSEEYTYAHYFFNSASATAWLNVTSASIPSIDCSVLVIVIATIFGISTCFIYYTAYYKKRTPSTNTSE